MKKFQPPFVSDCDFYNNGILVLFKSVLYNYLEDIFGSRWIVTACLYYHKKYHVARISITATDMRENSGIFGRVRQSIHLRCQALLLVVDAILNSYSKYYTGQRRIIKYIVFLSVSHFCVSPSPHHFRPYNK